MELVSPALWWRPRARNPGTVSQKGWLRVGDIIGRVSAMSCESRGLLSMATMTTHTGLSRWKGRRPLGRVTLPSNATL